MKEKKNKVIANPPEKIRKLYNLEGINTVQEEDETSIYEYDLPCLRNKGHLKRK